MLFCKTMQAIDLQK